MAASGFSDKKLLEYPYNPPGWMPNERDGLLKQPFIHNKGTITVPNKPGLGLNLNYFFLFNIYFYLFYLKILL